MLLKPSGMPKNQESLGVLGYLIIVNKQIHSYQIDVLNIYLKRLDLEIEDTVIADIIDGKDDALSFNSAISAFEKETTEIQTDLYYMLIVLAMVDNVIDDIEKKLISRIINLASIGILDIEKVREKAIEDANGFRKSRNGLYENKNIEKKYIFLNFFLKIWNFILTIINCILCRKGEDYKKNINSEKYAYKRALEKCAVVSSEDFKVVKPAYKDIVESGEKCISEIKKYKMSLSLDTGLSAEIAKIIEVFMDALNEKVLVQSKCVADTLIQKERTASDFTIAFIGRTKAGKSTLHSILTRQGTDKIGAGKQRTTRYNRIYQWNMLRMIDTPGIGSAEAEGRVDDEVARSVLGESDVICFVIVDDSILTDVLEFMEEVALLKKPILILLNHKENINNEVKFRRYIEKPMDWLLSEGDSNIKGHINRIKAYADEHGFGHLVNFFPVFLLAAQMASDEKYKKYKKVLWDSSNIDYFIRHLRNWIISSGVIKRSQTILDETTLSFDCFIRQIKKEQEPLLEQIKNLEKQKETKIIALERAKKQTVLNIKKMLDYKFNNLAINEALNFSEEIFNKKGDINELWRAFIAKIKFEDEIKSAIEMELNLFSKKIDDTIKDLFEDFYYSIKASFEIKNIEVPLQLDFKSISRLTSSVINVFGSIAMVVLGTSNPIGWILMVTGGLIGFGSRFFSSKEKKREITIDKVYNKIKDTILEQSGEQIRNTVLNIEQNLSENIMKIDSLYGNLINGLKETVSISNQLVMVYETKIDYINKVYAWRIIQFLQNRMDEYSYTAVSREILSVDRTKRGEFIIECTQKQLDTGCMDRIIAEKVIIV